MSPLTQGLNYRSACDDVQHCITARQACFAKLFRMRLPTAELAERYNVIASCCEARGRGFETRFVLFSFYFSKFL